MVSFKGCLVIITNSSNKRAISKREKQKWILHGPPDTHIPVKYVLSSGEHVLTTGEKKILNSIYFKEMRLLCLFWVSGVLMFNPAAGTNWIPASAEFGSSSHLQYVVQFFQK